MERKTKKTRRRTTSRGRSAALRGRPHACRLGGAGRNEKAAAIPYAPECVEVLFRENVGRRGFSEVRAGQRRGSMMSLLRGQQ